MMRCVKFLTSNHSSLKCAPLVANTGNIFYPHWVHTLSLSLLSPFHRHFCGVFLALDKSVVNQQAERKHYIWKWSVNFLLRVVIKLRAEKIQQNGLLSCNTGVNQVLTCFLIVWNKQVRVQSPFHASKWVEFPSCVVLVCVSKCARKTKWRPKIKTIRHHLQLWERDHGINQRRECNNHCPSSCSNVEMC